MRSRLRLPAALIVALLVPAASAGAATKTVRVTDNVFGPKRVQVNPGDTVTWTSAGAVAEHTVTSRRSAPTAFNATFPGEAGATFSRTFPAAGRYAYICQPHRIIGMIGVVQVGADRTAPKLSKVKLKRGKKSVKVSFAVSENARVKATFKRGRKTVKTLRTKTLDEDNPGSVTYKAKKLKAGSYSVSLVVTDEPGKNSAKAVKKKFKVPG